MTEIHEIFKRTPKRHVYFHFSRFSIILLSSKLNVSLCRFVVGFGNACFLPPNTYSPLQRYWKSEANPCIPAVDWKHLGLTLKDEFETNRLAVRRQHLLSEPNHFYCKQKYWDMWLLGVFCCPGVSGFIDYANNK